MNLDDVNRGIHSGKKRNRVGRGPGSGNGKTSGRGFKGDGSRAGSWWKPIFEGGQMPLIRRIPKRGFTNSFAKTIAIVNVGDLDAFYESGEEVSVETLNQKRLVRGSYDQLKILGDGELTKKLKVVAHKFTKSAAEKISQAGGEVVEIPAPKQPVRNKQASAGKTK